MEYQTDHHDKTKIDDYPEEESSVTEEMIEFLRKKTFTDDFKSLVDKVVFESKDEAPVEMAADSKAPSAEEDVIKRLQRLFYKTVNLSDGYSTGFNPLGSEHETVYEYSLRYVKETMQSIGLDEYAMLCYDPAYKSFIPRIHTIEGYDPTCMVIAPEDPLYRDVIHDAIGVTITPDSPRRAEFSPKHFVSGFSDSTLFLISVQNILNIFWAFNESRTPNSFIPTSLYPIFAVVVRRDDDFDHKRIVQTLQQKLPFAFYILHNNLRKDNVPPEYRTPAFLSALVDTYCRIYGHLDLMKCFVIKHEGKYSAGCYFFINYLWRQISSRTGPDSTAVQIEKDRIVLFLSPDDEKNIMEFLQSEGPLNEGTFTVKEIPSFSRANLFDILSR
jgi:hypothetical protein